MFPSDHSASFQRPQDPRNSAYLETRESHDVRRFNSGATFSERSAFGGAPFEDDFTLSQRYQHGIATTLKRPGARDSWEASHARQPPLYDYSAVEPDHFG